MTTNIKNILNIAAVVLLGLAFATSFFKPKQLSPCLVFVALICMSISPLINETSNYSHNKSSGILPPYAEKKKLTILSADSFCGFCKKLLGEVETIKRLLNKKGIEVIVISDIKEPQKFKEASQKFKARGFPHAVLDTGDGKTNEISGYMPAAAYVKKVESYL